MAMILKLLNHVIRIKLKILHKNTQFLARMFSAHLYSPFSVHRKRREKGERELLFAYITRITSKLQKTNGSCHTLA